MPLLSRYHAYLKSLDPEDAHRKALGLLNLYGYVPGFAGPRAAGARLHGELFGRTVFPFGLAAGVSKNAEALRGFQKLGLGFLEVGSVMPLKRTGNATSQAHPRIIRLDDGRSIINWMGLPSEGFKAALNRIKFYRMLFGSKLTIIVNIAVDPDRPNRSDLAKMAEAFAPYVDAFVINISCPNTAEVANKADGLIYDIIAVKTAAPGKPVLVKLGPTEKPEDLDHLQGMAMTVKADGFVLLNTTPFPLRRQLTINPGWLRDSKGNPQGGYSGPGAISNIVKMVERTRRNFPRTTIIATGPQGGADVVELLRAGANAVETNTWLSLQGPGVIAEAQQAILNAGGIANLQKGWLQKAA
jgi:dihydroorotate dehydrogenase